MSMHKLAFTDSSLTDGQMAAIMSGNDSRNIRIARKFFTSPGLIRLWRCG